LDIGIELIETVKKNAPNSAILILINKSDLKNEWDINEDDIIGLSKIGYEVIETSAKTNEAVELAFNKITKLML
ncbi:MAG TPA: hypothetical protein QF480_02545, partial [Bacteroidales bacterium]|nr:hypothetical protein [Bacteroidales bacterium]